MIVPVERCLRGACVVGSSTSICPYYCNGRDPLNPEIIARLWRDARCVLGLASGPPAHVWGRRGWRSPVRCRVALRWSFSLDSQVCRPATRQRCAP